MSLRDFIEKINAAEEEFEYLAAMTRTARCANTCGRGDQCGIGRLRNLRQQYQELVATMAADGIGMGGEVTVLPDLQDIRR
jgi:hypothetical protein